MPRAMPSLGRLQPRVSPTAPKANPPDQTRRTGSHANRNMALFSMVVARTARPQRIALGHEVAPKKVSATLRQFGGFAICESITWRLQRACEVGPSGCGGDSALMTGMHRIPTTEHRIGIAAT